MKHATVVQDLKLRRWMTMITAYNMVRRPRV